MSVASSQFGAKGKGLKTAIILLALRHGLSNAGVVAFMDRLDDHWAGHGKWKTSRGVVSQRRRGLRINGWEVDTAVKYHIPA